MRRNQLQKSAPPINPWASKKLTVNGVGFALGEAIMKKFLSVIGVLLLLAGAALANPPKVSSQQNVPPFS